MNNDIIHGSPIVFYFESPVLNNPLGYVDPSGKNGCPPETPCFDPGSGPGSSTPLPGDRDLTNWLYRELTEAIKTPEVRVLRALTRSTNPLKWATALEGWASLVRDRHRWDFKHRIEDELRSKAIAFHTADGTPYAVEYSVPGNVFYGYVGHSIFPGWLLHLGAGWAEGRDPSHVGDIYWYRARVCGKDYGFYFNWNWAGTLNDDPEDYRMIESGIQLWRTYEGGLEESQFVQKLEENRYQFPLVRPTPYGSDSPFGWRNPRGGWPYPVGRFNGSKPSRFDQLGLFQ